MLQRHAVPAGRPGDRPPAAPPRARTSSSPRARRAAGRCTSTPATAPTACRSSGGSPTCSRASTPSSRRRRRAPGWSATSTGRSPRPRGDPALEAAVGAVVPRVYELTEFLVDVLGVTDVGAAFPATVTLHPTCHSVRALGIGDRPRRLLRGGRRADPRRPARRRPVLRLRRHVRGQERRHVARDGLGQAGGRRDDRRRRADRGRHLVPDAPRRHAVAGRVAGPGACTWPRSSPRRARRDGTRPPAAATRRRRPTFAGTPPFPQAARTALADAQLRTNLARGDEDDPRPSAPGPSRSAPTGRRSASPARRSRTRSSATCPRCSSGSRRTSPPPAAPSTGRATRRRPTPSSPAWSARPAPTR